MPKYATGNMQKQYQIDLVQNFHIEKWVREWNGSFVHVSEFEPKQPQLEPKPTSADGIALRHVRTARTENAVPYSLPEDAFETYQAGSRVINVKAPGHGLTNGTTYRFRGPPLATTASGGTFQFSNPQSFDGITGANIAKATGYSITTGIFRSDARVSTDYAVANFFFFTVDTDTATIGGVKGGGVGCSVGPVTLSS